MKKEEDLEEKAIESYFCQKAKKYGYEAFKIIGVGHGGIPDRLVGAEGNLYVVEFKRPKGGVISALQKLVAKKLFKVGVKVHYLFTKKQVDLFFINIRLIWN